ncbi:hypothetical protein WA158_004740 [Blastocystis sp. Blastoise]
MVVYACPYGEYEATLQRQYAKNAGEIIQLYSGDSANLRNTLAFNDESVASQDTVVDYKVCIDGHTDYNLELLSKNSPTWADGSLITLTYNEIILVKTSLNKDGNGKKVIKFNLSSLVDSRMNWKYSTKVDSASWKESKIEEWGEDYKNKEIKNAEITTYFRKDITVDDSFVGLQLSVQSQSGFIVYVNGIKVDTYLLPESSNITQYTPSQSLEDIPTYKHIIIPKELLTSSVSFTILKIAIELHTKEDRPELFSSFDVLTYINDSKDSMNTLSMLASRRLQDIPRYYYKVLEEIKSIDLHTLISDPLVHCSVRPSLPIGLYMFGCVIDGTPREPSSNLYVITYYTDLTFSTPEQYGFYITVECEPSYCAHLHIERVSKDYTSYEKAHIKLEDGTGLSSIEPIYDNTNFPYDIYGPVGIWSFELVEEVNSLWSDKSLMNIYIIDETEGVSFPVTKMRTMYKSPETYYVNTVYSMLMNSEWKSNIYYSLPTEWYGSFVDDSKWPTIFGSNNIYLTKPEYIVFRRTINTPSIVNQKYFILGFKTYKNTKVYINNHELAVYGFKDDYLDSGDASTYIKKTVTGPLSLFDNQETITISALVFYNKNHEVAFDASLIMVVDTSFPVYSDYDVTVENASSFDSPLEIFDLTYSSSIIVRGKSDNTNPILSITTNGGYKLINKYCISYDFDNFIYAPTSWKLETIDVYGNSYVQSVVSDEFNTYTSQRRCFFLSDVTTVINKLEFTLTNNMINKAKNDYYISEIELFVDDITSESIPLLSTSSNHYYVYDNTTIFISFINFDYYHDLTITPSLPDGVSFDTTNGSIHGIIHGETGNIDYTIHAISITNTQCDYTLTISIQSCQFPYSFVNIQLEYEQGAAYKIELVSSMTSQHIINNYHIYKKSSEEYNVCLSPSEYSLSMSIMSGVSHSVSHIYVNNKYFSKFNQDKEVVLSFLQYADASKIPIVYSYDNINPPKHWTTNLFNDNLWSTVPSSSSLPDVPEDSITQYYRIHYSIDKAIPTNYQLDITVSTYAGLIIYINGYEVRRVNMNDGDNIEYNTLATTGYTEYKSFKSVISTYIDPSIYLMGDNVIAIEIHRYNNIIQPKNELSIVIELFNQVDSPIEGSWSVNGDVDPKYPLSKIYDNDIFSYIKVLNKCSNTIFTYTYNDEICIDINKYSLFYLHSMSISYSPVSIAIEGTYNNGAQWDELSLIDGISMSVDYYGPLYLNKCYNSYRMRITECGTDPNISESESESMTVLNELSYSSIPSSGCVNDEWSLSRYDKYSYKICPKGYTSNAKRLCSDGTLQGIEGDETCIKMNPSELYFEETSIIMIKGHKYEQFYTMDAIDTVITSSPSLPDGIMIDSKSQKLYGTPTSASPTTTYTLSYTNNEGVLIDLSQISITVIDLLCSVDNNWPATHSDCTASISCPQYYEGNQSRLCNYDGEWEEPNSSECIFNGSTPCTGTAYYNGNECEECINGFVTSLNGNNYLCTPCNDNEVVINNKCYPNDATCPAKTIDSYLYPETDILKNAVVNCTNDNQYGYYKLFCDYISDTPTWSNDINKDLCYPKPVSIPGKALESLEYSMQLTTTIDDIYSLLVSLARTFVNTYSYQLTDLLITTNYTTSDDSTNSLFLHAYYGSNRDFYSFSSSSKRKLYISNIINYPNAPFGSSSSLLNSQATLYNTNEYCQLPNQDVRIPVNYYVNTYKEIESQKLLSFLISSKVPISQLKSFTFMSNDGVLLIYYSFSVPDQYFVENATVSNYFDEKILYSQLKETIHISYSAVQSVIY